MGINDFQRPDRAGEKMTLLQWIRFFLALIPRIPAFIFSRPSIVDQRLSSVRTHRFDIQSSRS